MPATLRLHAQAASCTVLEQTRHPRDAAAPHCGYAVDTGKMLGSEAHRYAPDCIYFHRHPAQVHPLLTLLAFAEISTIWIADVHIHRQTHVSVTHITACLLCAGSRHQQKQGNQSP